MSAQKFFSFMMFFYLSYAHAIVDMRNANYSDTWVFLQVPGTGYDLKFQGSYNSRTLYSGLLGFGWCTDFETILKVTPENTLRITECGAGFEMEYLPVDSKAKGVNENIAKIMTEVRNRNKGKPQEYFANLEKELTLDSTLRDEFAKQLKIDGKIKENTKYVAGGRASDSIVYKGGEYTRTMASGSTQKFNKDGRLSQIGDRNGNFIKISYKGDKVTTVFDSTGASLQFKYEDNSKFIKSVVGPNNLTATFKFKGESLIESTNAGKNTFKYEYDELYNLTKVSYPDKTSISLTYNKDKDWVTSFTDRRGCKESYVYTENQKNPLNDYTSSVEKICGGKTTNKSSYQFTHLTAKDGRRYLAKTVSNINGKQMEITYHDLFGKPVEIIEDGVLSRFDYYPNGQMMRKTTAANIFDYKYETACNKVAQVVVTLKAQPNKSRQPSKAETSAATKKFISEFRYDNRRCNLTNAKNSSGQSVQLDYDVRGRITRILDQSRKEVLITYEERFGKPHIVKRPGLGTIVFKYKNDGTMEKFDSDDDPIVASQVLNVFSNMLEIIAPATTETNNI